MVHVNVPSSVRAQKMPVLYSPLDAEAEASFVRCEFLPSLFWVSLPSSLR